MPLNKQQLSSRFNSLPEEIKKWLNSELVGGTIEGINNALDLDGAFVRVLPELILRLVVSDFPPEEFIENLDLELGGVLGLDNNQLISITNQIEEKVLRPIERELLKVGVDARKILVNQKLETSQEMRQETRQQIQINQPRTAYQQPETRIPVRTPEIQQMPIKRPLPPQVPRRMEVGQRSEPIRPNVSTLEDRIAQGSRKPAVASGQVTNQENIITRDEIEKFRVERQKEIPRQTSGLGMTVRKDNKEELPEDKPFVLHRNE